MEFGSGLIASVELSWLAPSKLRRTVIVGSKRMVVYEDGGAEAIKIYDRGVDYKDPETFGEYQLSYRSGDILVAEAVDRGAAGLCRSRTSSRRSTGRVIPSRPAPGAGRGAPRGGRGHLAARTAASEWRWASDTLISVAVVIEETYPLVGLAERRRAGRRAPRARDRAASDAALRRLLAAGTRWP